MSLIHMRILARWSTDLIATSMFSLARLTVFWCHNRSRRVVISSILQYLLDVLRIDEYAIRIHPHIYPGNTRGRVRKPQSLDRECCRGIGQSTDSPWASQICKWSYKAMKISGQTNIPWSRQCKISWPRVLRIHTATASDASTLLMCGLSQQLKHPLRPPKSSYILQCLQYFPLTKLVLEQDSTKGTQFCNCRRGHLGRQEMIRSLVKLHKHRVMNIRTAMYRQTWLLQNWLRELNPRGL